MRLMFLLAIAVVGFPRTALGQIELSTRGSFLWVGTTVLEADSTHLLAGSPDGVSVYRKIAAAEFMLQAQIPVPGGVTDIAIVDSVAIIVDGQGGIWSFGHRSASSQTLPALLISGSGCIFVNVLGQSLLSISETVARSYDITDPFTPLLRSTVAYHGPGRQLSAADSLVLISCGSQGLVVLTLDAAGILSHTADFQPVTSGVPIEFRETATNGRHAWAPNGTNGVLIIDLTNPSAPAIQGRIITFGNAKHAALEGDRLLIADATAGVIAYRVTANGAYLWQSEFPALRDLTLLYAYSPTRFYSTNGGIISLLEVAALGTVSVAGQLGHPGGYNSIARLGPWVFVPDNQGFWRVHSDSAESDTSFFKFGSTKTYASLAYKNDLFTANGRDGVRRYRVFEEGTPILIGTLPARDIATGIVVDRDTAIVLENGFGYRLFDISIPSQPRIIGQDREPKAFPTGILPSTQFMYLAEGGGVLTVYDLEFPVKPEKVRVVPFTSQARQLRVHDRRLFVGDQVTGFLTYDIANESHPVLLSHPAQPEAVAAFRQSGRMLYTGGPDGVVSAYDLLDPDLPVLIAALALDAPVRAMEKHGELLFVLTESAFHAIAIGPPLVAGDFDASGQTDALDLVAMVDFVFGRGPAPWRPNAADVNADGRHNLQDVVLLVDHLYGGGTPLKIGVVE